MSTEEIRRECIIFGVFLGRGGSGDKSAGLRGEDEILVEGVIPLNKIDGTSYDSG